jgi:CRISPR-associated protein Cas6
VVHVELRFPILGAALPRDYGQAMFRAISRLIPEAANASWLLVKGVRPCGSIEIVPKAHLSMRLPQSRVSLMLKLSGKRIAVGSRSVSFGTPEISLLKPCSSLYASCVIINGCAMRNKFLNRLVWRLDEMGIDGEIELGLLRRFRAGWRVITGYALTLHDLSEESSITLQEQGLGNHRHLGCGFFAPIPRYLRKRADKQHLY